MVDKHPCRSGLFSDLLPSQSTHFSPTKFKLQSRWPASCSGPHGCPLWSLTNLQVWALRPWHCRWPTHPPVLKTQNRGQGSGNPQPCICRQPSSFPSTELMLSNQPDRASSPPSSPSAVWGCFGRANPHQVLTRWSRSSRLLEISCSWRSAISRPSVAEGRIPAAVPPLGQRPMLAFVRWEATTGFQLNF